MLTEEELEKLKREAKLMRKISREENVIPPNKVMAVKTRYKRKRKSTLEYINDEEE